MTSNVRTVEAVEPEIQATTEPEPTPELRDHLHGMWAAVAGGWAQHADFADERGAIVTERMLQRAALGDGERVLELACGAGGLGLAAAHRVGPHGEVVVSDVVPEMTAIATARAAALGLTNVSARELDLESIAEPDGAYDAVLCREGLMLVHRPVRAANEIRRVLRPGGRIVVSVWGARQRNPWLGLIFDAVSAELGRPVPPPGVPGPFSLDDAGELRRVLVAAGLSDVEIAELPTPYRADSFEEWWTRTSALAGPLSKMLADLPEPKLQALRARAHEAATAYETSAGFEFPGVCLIGSATNADADRWVP